MARRSGLGRGLGALIPPAPPTGESALREIPLASVRTNPFQPRNHFDEESLAALAASIAEVGVLQPILVRPLAPGGEHAFELIAGERRLRAARRAGLQTIPALVQNTDDMGALARAVIENVHRADLNPLEEAAAYKQLIEEFDLTHEEVGARVGKSRAAITNALRLFALPPSVQKLVATGELSAGHARALLGTPDRAFQEALARRAVAEGLSVRDVEEAVRSRSPEPAPAAARPARRLRPPGLLELEELLSTHLDTRVKVDMGPRKGRVVIEFASLEDLERIYRVMTEGRA